MRVLYLHQHFSTPAGRTGTRSFEFAKALVAAGHQVTVVCGSSLVAHTGLEGPFVKGQREGWVEGVRVVELALPYANRDGLVKRAFTFWRFAWRTLGLVRREPHDLLFATSTPLTAALPALAIRWLRGAQAAPFVFEVRDLWPELPKAMGLVKNPLMLAALAWLEAAAYRAAVAGVALAPGIAEGMAARGLAPDRVALIPNGCDLGLFAPGAEGEARPAFPGLPEAGPQDLIAIFPGAHGRANGLDAALDAAAVLRDAQVKDVWIVLMGEGSEKPRLQARAEAEGLSQVRFFSAIPKTELAKAMARVDVGLQLLADVPAFYRGTSPNKAFDFLAQGLPVLTNYPGWVGELVVGHGAGLAVPPGDPKAFAEALLALRDDPARRRAMGQAARRLAEEGFARPALAHRFVAWLEAAAQGPEAARAAWPALGPLPVLAQVQGGPSPQALAMESGPTAVAVGGATLGPVAEGPPA